MKYKTNNQISSYPLISFLNNESINKLNNIFKTHYTKQIITNQIVIKRKEQGFDFWNKLTRQNRQARIEKKI